MKHISVGEMTIQDPMGIMNIKCPREQCGVIGEKKVMHYHDGTKHIDGLKGWDLLCPNCGIRWLEWESSTDEIKKVYGESWKNYV